MPPTREDRTTRPWLRPLLGATVVLAAAGVVMSFLFLGRWTRMTAVAPAEVDGVFAAALAEAGGGPPYVEIAADGTVTVHHELEPAHPEPFATLTLLAWSPGEAKAVRIDYPRWFVKLKTSTFVNLGTMIAAARRDWRHLDLQIKYGDLVRRGPGLILDETSLSGARILLWTSARAGRRAGPAGPAAGTAVPPPEEARP